MKNSVRALCVYLGIHCFRLQAGETVKIFQPSEIDSDLLESDVWQFPQLPIEALVETTAPERILVPAIVSPQNETAFVISGFRIMKFHPKGSWQGVHVVVQPLNRLEPRTHTFIALDLPTLDVIESMQTVLLGLTAEEARRGPLSPLRIQQLKEEALSAHHL